MFKKIIISVAAIAAISSSAFADDRISRLSNMYDVSINCEVAKQVFEYNGVGSITFTKNSIFTKGKGETITLNPKDFCSRLGSFFVSDRSRFSKYNSFMKERLAVDDSTTDSLVYSTTTLLLNQNTKSTNVIDFTSAILDNNFQEADKIITENRKILYFEGAAYEKKSAYGTSEVPKRIN